MTLLRLSPDSERLRRIAKAHAAGELSTPDYRRIRAQVIDGFAGSPTEVNGDDTQPRWLYRPKAPAIKTDPPVPPRASGPLSPFWAWLLALVTLAIVVVVVSVAANVSLADSGSDHTRSAIAPTAATAQFRQSLQTTL